MSKNKKEAPTLIYNFLTKHSCYFSYRKDEIFNSIRDKVKRKVHIKNIIDKEVSTCFNNASLGMEKGLRTLGEFREIA